MSEYISAADRRAVAERAEHACEYCGVPDIAPFLPHEPDHIIALQHGGKTTLENLAYACFECNRFKGPNLSSIDPDTGVVTTLFIRVFKHGATISAGMAHASNHLPQLDAQRFSCSISTWTIECVSAPICWHMASVWGLHRESAISLKHADPGVPLKLCM